MYGAGSFLLDCARQVSRVLAVISAATRRVGAVLDWSLGPLDRIPMPFPAVVAALLAFAVLLACPNINYNFVRDEGYLWYGAQRVLAGEIPFRDFQSYYDPARYYLTGAVMMAFGGHGILALWRATALFGALVVLLAGWLLFRGQRRAGLCLTLLFTATLIPWMFPESYKLLDIATSLVLVGLLAWFIEQPTRLRCFVAGLVLGLVAIMGRNHALYGTLADLVGLGCVTLVQKRARPLPAFAWWAAGGLVGYLPMLLALAFVPGLWGPFWDSIRLYFVLGRTNLGLPVPWPWQVPAGMTPVEQLRYMATGSLLILQPLFGLAVAGHALWRAAVRKLPLDPLLFAAALLAVFYTHHAFARPGLSHLAQAIYPALLAAFLLIMHKPPGVKLALASVLCALSLFVEYRMLPPSGLWPHKSEVTVQIGADTVPVDKPLGILLTQLTKLVDKYAPDGRGFVAVPYLPGCYAMFDRPAVVWSAYMLSPVSEGEEAMEIRRIQEGHPGFILVEWERQDHNPKLAFKVTHKSVYAYIQQHYRKAEDPDVPERMELYLPPAPGRQAP